jgi:hypothetical protein
LNKASKKRGRESYKMEEPKSMQEKKTTNKGKPEGEHEQIKFSNPLPIVKGTYQIKRGEHHMKEHLA